MWGPVGASPHPVADEEQDPIDPNKSPNDTTGYPHSSPFRGRLMGRMQYAPTLTAKNENRRRRGATAYAPQTGTIGPE